MVVKATPCVVCAGVQLPRRTARGVRVKREGSVGGWWGSWAHCILVPRACVVAGRRKGAGNTVAVGLLLHQAV